MHVLDVACGPGLVTQCALDVVGPSGSVIGLDPSTGMLREAQKGPCQHLVRGVGESLPFPDRRFDFLSMGYALRHVPDLKGAFAEYRRVLKPSGIVLLLEISRPKSATLLTLSRFYIKTVLGTVFSAERGIATCRPSWPIGGIRPSIAYARKDHGNAQGSRLRGVFTERMVERRPARLPRGQAVITAPTGEE